MNIYDGISRTQKPKTQCKPHRQIGRKQCSPKWEDTGITLSSSLTLKSSNIVTGKTLEDHLVQHSPFTYEKSGDTGGIWWLATIMQQLTNRAGHPELLIYNQMPSSQTILPFLQFLCNHFRELWLCLITQMLLCVSWLSTSFSINCIGLKFIL